MPNTEPQSLKSAHRQRINKAASIACIVFGLFVALVGFSLGFNLNDRMFISLWATRAIFVVLGLVVGGLTISFGPMRSLRILLDAVYINDGGAAERLKTNIQICECGAKLSVLAGIVAMLSEFVNTMDAGNIDKSVVVWHVAGSIPGIIFGLTISVVVFLPLKYLFSHRASEETDAAVKS